VRFSRKTFPAICFLFLALVFSAQIIPNIFNLAPTDDEPMEMTNGYYYWNGDVLTHNRHPPLANTLQALPLRSMALNDSLDPGINNPQLRAHHFFFILNKAFFEEMTHRGRFVTLLFGMGIGFLLFLVTGKSHPAVWATTLVLWAFEPTILAYSGLAMADIPVAFFFLASILAFQKHLEKPGPAWSLAAGGLAALAACSKFSALILILVFGLLESCRVVQSKKITGAIRHGLTILMDWIWGLGSFLFVICILYLPGTLSDPDHRSPFTFFLLGLNNMMNYSHFHHPTYFLGEATRENHWLYFPVSFLLKSTIPYLVFVLMAAGFLFRKRPVFPPWNWLPPFIFFLAIIPVQNIGIRYLLPAYPFFILMASGAAGELWTWKASQGRNIGKLAVIGLLFWHVTSVLASAPNMISYFNDFISFDKKIYCLGDSNLDMGQDIKKLAHTARQRDWKNVKLAQFGGALDPSYYGLHWTSWTARDLSGPQPGFVYAVNISLFQLGPEFSPSLVHIAKSWISTTTPTGRVGDTWFYYEIPGNPQPDLSPSLSSVCVF
jgi:hypothetical protein